MKKIFLLSVFILTFMNGLLAQTGTEFWFAAPEVTVGHNDAGPKFRLTNTSSTLTAHVTVNMPAQPWTHFNPGTLPNPLINIAPNGTYTLVLDAVPNSFKDTIENKPTNTILTKGLHITSDVPVTAYYEVDNSNNNEIFALKGANALGTQFYIPITTNPNLSNHTPLTPSAYTTFDIVATQNATTVRIFTRVPVDGHAANVPFTITLNAGQTYSCGWTGAGFDQASNQPAGSVVLSDKPIAITVKEDSKQYSGQGCYDLIGDQIVPVDIVGTDYIVIKGQLAANAGESFFILATQNNTNVYVNGVATPVATLFAGQTYYQDNITLPRYYIHTDAPVYCTQVTGTGCELGSALLPPLNCAGSSSVSFVRSTTEFCYLNIMVRAGSQGNFTLTGGSNPNCITAADFAVVPGTGGQWVSTYGKSFSLAEIPQGVAMRLTNSTDVFGMGLFNGDLATGVRYGFFSEFAAKIVVEAGPNQSICANTNAQLNGSVSGGANTGIWTTSGSGMFSPNSTTLNAQYVPSVNDINNGSVTLTLTSTSVCFPVSDVVTISFQAAPAVNAGVDQNICKNNPNVTLNGAIANALGGVWSGGAGFFSPSNTALNAVYTPTPAEIASGSLTLTLTSTGNGVCNPQTDVMVITFTPSPTVNAGVDQAVGANNPNTILNGSVTVATGGIWSGGSGSFNPSNVALGAIYTPSPGEIAAGTVTLTLTTTGNGNCIGVSDNMTITISPAPVVNAGVDQIACANNPTVTLNSSVTNATGGIWSGGMGLFSPNNTALNATYTPTAGEIASGSVTLVLTSTGNGFCNPVSDNMTITYTTAPTANAGVDQSVCANSPHVNLNGSVTVATGGTWSGGAGTYNPSISSLIATYTPSATEISAGTVTLTLTTTGNGNCLPVSDNIIITITPAPTVNAGVDQTSCANNPSVILNGSVTVATGGIWTGGAGSYNPNNITLGAIYTPSAGEIAAGTATLTLTSTGNGNCLATSDNMTITITPAPIVNAGANQIACANNPAVTLNGSVTNASGGIWSGGMGLFSPNNSALNATYTPTAGEIAGGILTLTLTSTGNGTCNPVSSNKTITYTPSPTANAGVDVSVCANNHNVTLNGSVTIATGGIWSGGTGTYNPNNITLNAVYTPSAAEIAAGHATLTLTTTGNGNCVAVSDNMNITITPSPVVDAGINMTSCVNNPSVTLNGSVTNATGGQWSGGAGVYNPNNTDPNATYTPSVAEIAAGTATLTLTSTGNGNCLAVSDNMTITINPAPTANAGPDQVVCSNNANITLNGSVVLAAGGHWSGGMGIFTPNNSALNAVYTPTQGEINSGLLTLTLTTTGNGSCNPATDNMSVTFTPSPIVNAGIDQTVCGNNPNVTLSGTVAIATGGIWSGGLGTFTPNNTSLNAIYHPTAGEIAAGTVTLTLTSTGNGTCNAVTDNVIITITPAPTVNAGSNQTACVNSPTVTLNGIITHAGGGQWSGGLGSYNPSNTDLHAAYTPTPAEISSGSVTLTLTSTGNGSCLAVTDNMLITFTPAPTANAGPDQVLCSNNSNITLNGSVALASGGQWSGGLGIFTPSATTLNAIYTPSAGELAFGSVTLTLTTTGNGLCNAATDNMTATFTTSPTVNAGIDKTVCANNPNVSLSGSVTIATGGIWTGGAGTYTPNNTSLNITYTPTPAEIAIGHVTLILTTTGNGNCIAVSDNVLITITPSPIVNAGTDIISCVNNPTVTLDGTITNALGGIWTGGVGVFNPNSTTLNATYTPTPAEIASGGATLTLTSTGNGNCLSVSDNVHISFNPSPIVNAGTDQIKCANNAATILSGSIINATGGQWSGGLGIYNPNNNTLNATYTPTAGEIASGNLTLTLTSTGNGTCNAVTDNMTITFTTAPTSNAGIDQAVCANNPAVTLNGSITISSSGIWSGGTGTYNPNNTTLNAVYTPSPAEITAGTVTLTLTTTGNGSCNAVSDNIVITITPSPTANAGPDKSVCKNNPNVSLHGLVTVATGGIWSGGAGVYNPSNTDLNAVYTPTPAEILAGSLVLTLTTTGNGNCNPVSDNVTITFTPEPIVNAGVDQTVCANTSINLFGTVLLASGGSWSGGLGIFTPNNTTLNAVYSPTTGEILAGSIDLTLTSTGNGTCNPVTDQVHITFTPAPTVSAGTNQTVCANNASVALNGSVAIATGGHWTTSGSGIFTPNSNTLNAIYSPSNNDINAGSVTLYLTSTGNGNCNAVVDSMKITITPAPVVEAGSDQTVCVDNLVIPLSGMVTGGATTGIWSTSGTGIFVPSNSMLTASYIASSADSLAQSVKLTLTSTNNGNCIAVHDTMHIFIYPAGIANAGSDVTVCANNGTVSLNGSVSGGAFGGVWSSTGTGTFTPNTATLNATYHPSAADTASGSVILILTANSCDFASDSITVTITPAPQVDAGADIFICNRTAQLNASIYGGTNTGIWTTSGTGIFSPSNTDPNAIYHASVADSVSGTVMLILTSTNNGTCLAGKDTVIITITTPGAVNAGPDQVVCDNQTISLNGSITGGASLGIWTSSGTGTFTPSNTDLNATYIPSGGDLAAGNVMLILTATNSCNPVFDNILVTFIPSPTSDAGPDQTVCANNSVITLSGTVTNSSGILWTTSGSGTYTPNATSLNVMYIPSANDITTGSVFLYLTSSGNGSCSSVIDSMELIITPAPVVNAGMDQNVCKTSSMAQMMGSVSGGASTGMWTTTGSGNFIPDNLTMNAYYQYSTADTAAGSVSLILTSTNNGTCLPVSDTVNIIFGNTSFVYAGPDQTVCGGLNLVNLNGFVTGGSTTGQWVTLGSGSFFPFDTLLNAIYVVSAADSINGFVNLLLISTYNGTCNAGSDTMTIFIDRVPVVNAGNDLSECYGNTSQLNGTVAFAAGGVWATLGTGTFIPDANTLTAQYIPSYGDSIAGFVTLILTSTGSATCSAVSDTMHITYMKPLIPDFNVSVACENHAANFTDNTTIISGSISNWLWDFGGGNLANTQNASFVFTILGSHLVTLTVTSNLGCSFSVTKTVIVNPSPVVAFTSTMTCAYQNVNFTDGSSISSGSITNWDWSFGDGHIDSVQDPSHIYNKDTIFSVTLIVTSDAGCVDSVSNNITFYASPIANFTNSVECANVPIPFTDFSTISSGFINSWSWDFGNGATSGVQNPTTLYPTGGNYNVTLIVQSDHGCKDTIIKPIDVFTGPTAGFSVSGDLTTGNTLTFTNTSTGITASNWDFGDGVGTSTIQSPMYTYNTEGNYMVTLIVWDEHNCPDTATTDLFIVKSLTTDIYPPKVPTGFSPNGDGQNDTLYVRGGPFKLLEFKVFNTWGQEIFNSNDASFGWDGTWKNYMQPVGVYTWTVKATTVDGIEYKKSGNVNLIR